MVSEAVQTSPSKDESFRRRAKSPSGKLNRTYERTGSPDGRRTRSPDANTSKSRKQAPGPFTPETSGTSLENIAPPDLSAGEEEQGRERIYIGDKPKAKAGQCK